MVSIAASGAAAAMIMNTIFGVVKVRSRRTGWGRELVVATGAPAIRDARGAEFVFSRLLRSGSARTADFGRPGRKTADR
ncbi:hypothetical protein GCM10010195_61700 [Kitasatospora griseola]|nr:hypothetical protein GCM10010195_61700 [Kitasatospora griseola]